MNILVLTKRQYTNKDLIDDQYGRLWEIPLRLSEMGHNINCVCLSYRKRNEGRGENEFEKSKIEWNTFNIATSSLKYLKFLHQCFRRFKPDIIFASSDCFHVIWGVLLSKLYRIPCIVDLYDNYESFSLSRVTGIIPLFRMALKLSDKIICVSKPLQKKLVRTLNLSDKTYVIGNGVDTKLFFPRSRNISRDHFMVSDDVKVIGTAGGLNVNRGITNLYRAFEVLAENNNDLYLALAGAGSRDDLIFKHPQVIDFGVLQYDEIPLFYNMLDVAVICNQKNNFGEFCFPQKGNEILACKIPLVAANVGVMSDILASYSECLFDPKNYSDLAHKLQQQLNMPTELNITCKTWDEQAKRMSTFLADFNLQQR